MEKIYNSIKKISRLVVIIGLLVLAGFTLIFGALDLSERFFGFVADGLTSLLSVCLYALPAVLLLMKKDEEAKFFMFVLLSIQIVGMVSNYITRGWNIRSGAEAMTIIYALVYFLQGLLLLTCVVFFVLFKAFKINLNKILNLLVTIALGFFAVLFLVSLIAYIVWKSDWTSFFGLFTDLLILPFVIFCALISYQDVEVKEEVKEDKKEEPKTSDEVPEEPQNEEQTSNEVQTSEDEQTPEEKTEE